MQGYMHMVVMMCRLSAHVTASAPPSWTPRSPPNPIQQPHAFSY